MADEAFALSPISARASMPSAEDYDAISQAFMETSRGRWFLGEYAKRNRNADTSMVLDAVARIEQTIAAQRQPAATDSGLAEALTAIRAALDEARVSASAALDSLALDENLAPVRKGARVIKEIAWRWREIGADGRICDLLDSQVSAIEVACGQISMAAPNDALSAAFDLIEQRIAAFGDGDGPAAPAAEQASPSPASAASVEIAAAAAETARAAIATDTAEAAISPAAMPAEEIVASMEVVDAAAEVAEAADAEAEVAEITADACDAHDEALLDLVAFEMSAPDPSDFDEAADADADEIRVAEPVAAEPFMVAPEPEPVATPAPEPVAAPTQPLAIHPSLQPSLEPQPEPSREPSPEPSHEHSLGSSLIASGILRRPHSAASDPLAAIRRLSQAEKIALFS